MATEGAPVPYLEKIKGIKLRSGIAYPKWYIPLIGALGGFLAIALVQLLSVELDLLPCFIVPFGASCVLLFSAPSAPFSQPRNVIGGHVVAALVGLGVHSVFQETTFWTLALANGLAIGIMVATKTVHPPAGATAFLPLLTGISNWSWALVPVAVGAVILVIVAVLYSNLYKNQRYPVYWI